MTNKIEIDITDLINYISEDDLNQLIENKLNRVIEKCYENSIENMIYDRIDNALSLILRNKMGAKFEEALYKRAMDTIPRLKPYEIFNYEYNTGKPHNEPARVLDRMFDDNLKSKLRRKLIVEANKRVKNVTREEIIEWTGLGLSETIADLFKFKEENK